MREVWIIRFGKSVRHFYTSYHAYQFAEALKMNGTDYTLETQMWHKF